MAGRKPLPTKLKVLKGTTRKGRENASEAIPVSEIPAPPEFLSREALMEWGRITPELVALGLMSKIDRAALAAYCQAYGRWWQAEQKINELACLVEVTTNGNNVQSVYVGIANRSMDLMHKFLTEFGMTPSARSRVKAEKPEEKRNKFEAFGG